MYLTLGQRLRVRGDVHLPPPPICLHGGTVNKAQKKFCVFYFTVQNNAYFRNLKKEFTVYNVLNLNVLFAVH